MLGFYNMASEGFADQQIWFVSHQGEGWMVLRPAMAFQTVHFHFKGRGAQTKMISIDRDKNRFTFLEVLKGTSLAVLYDIHG